MKRLNLFILCLVCISGLFAQTPQLNEVNPDEATIPDQLTVEISGTNSHFAMGTGTTVWFARKWAGEIDSINLAIGLVRRFGEILFFGCPRAQTIPLNFDQLFHKCCRATTIVDASAEPGLTSMRQAVDLIASGEADAASLITHRVGFDDVIEAYEMHHARADGAVKIVVEMPGAVS